jgi:hypothetical protein
MFCGLNFRVPGHNRRLEVAGRGPQEYEQGQKRRLYPQGIASKLQNDINNSGLDVPVEWPD